MSPSADEALLAALGAVARTFRELGAPAMIIGGVAVIARGVPRQTIDVDGTVWAETIDLDRLFDVLRGHGLVPRIADARDFARQRQVLLLRHEPSGTPVEVSLAWRRDRDRSDVERLLVLYGSGVNLDRIRSIIGDIAAVLDEPDRLAEFEVIVRRVKEATREEPT